MVAWLPGDAIRQLNGFRVTQIKVHDQRSVIGSLPCNFGLRSERMIDSQITPIK